VTDRWFSPGTRVSSTNKTDCHDITEILLKVALNIINQTKPQHSKHRKMAKTAVDEILGPCLGQAEKCGRIKPFNEMRTLICSFMNINQSNKYKET
jgi:hypothetical protein